MRAVSLERAIELFNEFGQATGASAAQIGDLMLVDGYTDYKGRKYEMSVCTTAWLIYEVYRLQRQQSCFKQPD